MWEDSIWAFGTRRSLVVALPLMSSAMGAQSHARQVLARALAGRTLLLVVWVDLVLVSKAAGVSLVVIV